MAISSPYYLKEQKRKRMKEYFWNCTNNPFPSIELFNSCIKKSKRITSKTFFENCIIPNEILYVRKNYFKEFPNDFMYFKYKNIYFFTHSCIEYFFK